jgi:ATP-dependent Lon protease
MFFTRHLASNTRKYPAMNDDTTTNIPEILPLFPLKDVVAFPHMIFPLFLKEEELQAFEEAKRRQNFIALIKMREIQTGNLLVDLHEIGTVCKVMQLYKLGRRSEGNPEGVMD